MALVPKPAPIRIGGVIIGSVSFVPVHNIVSVAVILGTFLKMPLDVDWTGSQNVKSARWLPVREVMVFNPNRIKPMTYQIVAT